MAQTIPLSMPDDLLAEVRETAKVTHLSVQDVIRQSVKIARPVLRGTIKKPQRPKTLSVWDALPARGIELAITPLPDKVKKITL